MQHDRALVRRLDAMDAKFRFVTTGAITAVSIDPLTREVQHLVKEPSRNRCDVLCKTTGRKIASAFGEDEMDALRNAVPKAEEEIKKKSPRELALENAELKRKLAAMETGGNPLNKPKRGLPPPPVEDPKPKVEHDPGDETEPAPGEKPWHDGMEKDEIRQLIRSNNLAVPGNIGREKLIELAEEHGLHLSTAN